MAGKENEPNRVQGTSRADDPKRLSGAQQDDEFRKEHDFEHELPRQHDERLDPDQWAHAMAWKREMPQASLELLDPGPDIFECDGSIAAVVGEHAQNARLNVAKNPQPNGSFGFAGSFVTLETDKSFAPAVLALRFDPQKLGPVVRHSLRLFRWDEQEQRFALVHTSRVSLEGDYVFGAITRNGLYAVIGINADPLVLWSLRILSAIGSLGAVLPEAARRLVDPICTLILCAPELRQSLEVPRIREQLIRVGAEMGFPLPTGDYGPLPGGGDLCERCLGTGGLRLPEFELLPGDTTPPYRPCVSSWESIGPVNFSGPTAHVHIDPTNPDRIYCVSFAGGIWVLESVSRYPVVTWRPLTDQIDYPRMAKVAVAPSDENVIYASNPWYLHRSDNRGTYWRRRSHSPGSEARSIIVHPTEPNTVYLATVTGFHVSLDGGARWTNLYAGNVVDASIDPLDPSIIYIAAVDEGILKTMTAGIGPWTVILPFSRARSSPTSGLRIALGYRNADGSLQTDANRTVVAKFGSEIFVNQRGGRDTGSGWISKGTRGDYLGDPPGSPLAVDPFDPETILAGESELHRSEDGFDTWSTVASENELRSFPRSITFDRSNRGVVYLGSAGVYRSSDGGRTWLVRPISVDAEISAQRSLVKNLVTASFIDAQVQGHTALGSGHPRYPMIATTALPTGRWETVEHHLPGLGADIYADPKRVGRFYICHHVLSRMRYPGTGGDDFVTIGEFHPFESGAFPGGILVNRRHSALAVDARPGSNIILVCALPEEGGGHRLMMTREGDREPRTLTDGSVINQPTWTTVIEYRDSSLWFEDPIAHVAFARSEPARAYAMSCSGKVFRKNNVDIAGSWDELGRLTTGLVRAMAVNKMHAERLYAIGARNVNRSEDGGGHWSTIGARSLPDVSLNSIVTDPRVASRLYLGAYSGVFVSDDEGDTWAPFDAELPNVRIGRIFANDGYLYALMSGRGLWRRSLCY